MIVKCNFCDNMIDETAEKCENCGAPNERMIRVGNGVPKTIAELEAWYKEHKLPSYETTRFFIGIDYKKPKAFGIYKNDEGNFVVYKNKDTGERAIRYEGPDEVYAVNELYLKLKSEIQNQKNKNNRNKNSSRGKKNKGNVLPVMIVVIVILAISAVINCSSCGNGYYRYDNNEYYKHNYDWYVYDTYVDDWVESTDTPTEFVENYKDYSDDYYDGLLIENSNVSDSWSSDSWDSDSSWDSSDSWDSGGSDWGSDW